MADGNETLRGNSVGHGLKNGLGDELDIDTGIDSSLCDIRVTLESGRGRVELDDELWSVGQGLSNGLRPFQKEEPGLGPGSPRG